MFDRGLAMRETPRSSCGCARRPPRSHRATPPATAHAAAARHRSPRRTAVIRSVTTARGPRGTRHGHGAVRDRVAAPGESQSGRQ